MIQRLYYNASVLERSLAVFETHFGLSSADFYKAHVEDDPAVQEIPGYLRHQWASLYRELQNLADHDEFSERIERELEMA